MLEIFFAFHKCSLRNEKNSNADLFYCIIGYYQSALVELFERSGNRCLDRIIFQSPSKCELLLFESVLEWIKDSEEKNPY